MRKLFTTQEFFAGGRTRDGLDWALHKGTFVHVARGVFADGPEPPTRLESAIGSVFGTPRTARALAAAAIHDLDGLTLSAPSCGVLARQCWLGQPSGNTACGAPTACRPWLTLLPY